jgi:ATP-dependent protease HslVU (ClpYQ) peptidase subunit
VSDVVAVRKEGRTAMAADTQSNCGGNVELWEAT